MTKYVASILCVLVLNAGAASSRKPDVPADPAADGGPTFNLTSSKQPASRIHRSLQNEVHAAADRGLDWLVAQQKEDGSWSNSNFPALTGLAIWALAGGEHPQKKQAIARGVKYILSCVRDDGGIYRKVKDRQGGGLSNYNTAICMTALHATGDPALVPVILKARKYIAGAQHFGDDVYKGGFGYDADTDRAYTDLLNTFYSVQAMRLTQDVEDLRGKGETRVDINWAETVKYIQKMQNPAETGKDQAGGFFYKPGQSKAGTFTNATGKVVFRSYGSMTYVGLLALVYADVDREDVRVRSAFDWSEKHWALEENPGMGAQGLYFFYHVLTRSLDAYGADLIERPNGAKLNWREALAHELIDRQEVDPKTGHGYWINRSGRFWENDPVLTTAYSLLALEQL